MQSIPGFHDRQRVEVGKICNKQLKIDVHDNGFKTPPHKKKKKKKKKKKVFPPPPPKKKKRQKMN